MAMHTDDKWTAFGEQIKKQVAALKDKPFVAVGILARDFGKPHADEPTEIGIVAVSNEFGTDRIPERSYLRSTCDEKQHAWLEKTEKERAAVMAGQRTVKLSLSRLGLIISQDIKAKIRSNVPPPNAPSTVKRKGSSGTLRDTGQLMNSIAYEVKDERTY